MKWLWMEWRPGLWAGSYTEKSPNGTLPMVSAKLFSGTRVVSNPSRRICAEGYRAAATAAVNGSFSTPTMTAFSGAWLMNVPLPQPGSSTRPPLNPAWPMASQMTAANAGSV
ncbi:Uncharacterised protein [Mycobacteroides abscessus subsp. abscessus]|nr:Uncharacterised protein [Mycobacteroides abscessus subsp. abscessus]